MLSNANEVFKRISEASKERMKDIYTECEKKGLSKRFADNFYFRMIQNPLKQTKTMIAMIGDEPRYLSEAQKNIKQWQMYLEIMLELSPQHEKANEWKKALELLR